MTRDLIEFTRINADSNGNSRHVVHFLSLLTEKERTDYKTHTIFEKYAIAVKRAHKIGGRKFHNKQFGGGIVFQCQGESEIEPHIDRVLREAEAQE